MLRARENYVAGRSRVGRFTAAQLERVRDTYELHQKTLNKILENIPVSLDYLEACRVPDEEEVDEDPAHIKGLWEVYMKQVRYTLALTIIWIFKLINTLSGP